MIPLLILAVPLSGACQEPQNLLKNPGFSPADAGDTPADWGFADFGTGGKPAYDAETGAVGIRVDDPAERGAWRQGVTLDFTGHLFVSGRHRTEGITDRGREKGAVLRLSYLRAPGGWDLITDQRIDLPPADDWTAFERTVAIPAGAGAVWPELFNFFAPGEVWWDDLVIRQATPDESRAALAADFDREPNASEAPYMPADGTVATVNPPAFNWLPAGAGGPYLVEYAASEDFSPDTTTRVDDILLTVFTPTETIPPGDYHWRYGIESEAGPVWSEARSFTVPEDAPAFPRPKTDATLANIPDTRPRAYFTPDTVAEIRAETDTQRAKMVDGIRGSARKLIGQDLYPEPPMLPKGGQERSIAYQEIFRTMRPFTSGMERCALAYVLTGEREFAEEAKRRLLHFASWDTDGSSGMSHNDEAAMDLIMRCPRTYDWIHDTLGEDERRTVEEMCRVRLAQTHALHRRMPFDSRPYSSHPGRMVGFMMEGSIIFAHELPEARDWLDYYLKLFWSVYPAWAGDGGGWAEGISYWSAYISMLTQHLFVMDSVGIPYREKPFIRNTGYFGLYCAPPFAKQKAFGDGHESSINKGIGTLLYLHSSLHDDPYLRWYAEVFGSGPGSSPAAFTAVGKGIAAGDPSDLPQARVFPQVGWVAMHSDMSDPATNIHFMLKSSPYGSYSHSHASQNAFIVNAFGEALAISSGYYQRYGSPHHAGWTWETRAHCSVLVDNEGQVKRSKASNGFIADFADVDDFSYTMGDATAAYGGRLESFTRAVTFVRPKAELPGYFVMIDDLRAPEPRTYQWLLHARKEMAIDEASSSVTSTEGEAHLRVQFLWPEALELSQHDQFSVPPLNNAANQWHFTASTTEKRVVARIVTLLVPYQGDEAPELDATLLRDESGVAVRVDRPDGQDLIVWRPERATGPLVIDEVSSEATVCVIRRDAEGEVEALFVHGGEIDLGGERVASNSEQE